MVSEETRANNSNLTRLVVVAWCGVENQSGMITLGSILSTTLGIFLLRSFGLI